MKRTKPRITRFGWHKRYMWIDRETTLYAFVISHEDGGAKIFMVPPGIHFGIEPEQMLQFRLVHDEETSREEVMLDLTFQSEPESLGVTDQAEDARKWVRDANALLEEAKRRRGLK